MKIELTGPDYTTGRINNAIEWLMGFTWTATTAQYRSDIPINLKYGYGRTPKTARRRLERKLTKYKTIMNRGKPEHIILEIPLEL